MIILAKRAGSGNFKRCMPLLKDRPPGFMLKQVGLAVAVSLFCLLDGVATMPWLEFLLVIASVYLLVKCVQGLRDFINWYREGRAFAAEQKRLRALRRQERTTGVNMPALKERPSSKPPIRPDTKPPKKDSGITGL
jgi:hypothetical protein